MTLLEVFEVELALNGLQWCRDCHVSGHKRGFVLDSQPKVVHLDSQIQTRSTLHRGLHEIGHAVHDQSGMRRFQKEAQAEAWAGRRMRELGINVPRKAAAKGRRYVARMKNWGDKIKAARA